MKDFFFNFGVSPAKYPLQGSIRLEKYLYLEGFLEKFFKLKPALKLKSVKSP